MVGTHVNGAMWLAGGRCDTDDECDQYICCCYLPTLFAFVFISCAFEISDVLNELKWQQVAQTTKNPNSHRKLPIFARTMLTWCTRCDRLYFTFAPRIRCFIYCLRNVFTCSQSKTHSKIGPLKLKGEQNARQLGHESVREHRVFCGIDTNGGLWMKYIRCDLRSAEGKHNDGNERRRHSNTMRSNIMCLRLSCSSMQATSCKMLPVLWHRKKNWLNWLYL